MNVTKSNVMPFTGAGFVPVASAFAWLVLPICLLSGCSGGADGSGFRPAEVIESAEDRAARWAGLFAEAEGRAALWCTETQVATARLEGSGLEDKIELEVLQTATMLTAAETLSLAASRAQRA